MTRYLVRRALQSFGLLLLLTLAFYVMIFRLGDPLAKYATNPRVSEADRTRLRAEFGLDKPLHEQYLSWLGNVVQGKFGSSLKTKLPVINEVWDHLQNSLLLMITAFVVQLLIAIPIGIYSALRQYSWLDNLVTGATFIFYSLPVFFLGVILIFLFAVQFKEWGLPSLPPGKMFDLREGQTVAGVARHLVLPVLTLVLINAALYVRYLRSSMLEVLTQDYMRTARAKGLSNSTVLRRHAFKNAALPLVTLIMLQLAGLFSGAVVTERLFSWPGMGTLFINSVEEIDYPVLMAILTIAATLIIVANLLADVLYAYLDPRIRYS